MLGNMILNKCTLGGTNPQKKLWENPRQAPPFYGKRRVKGDGNYSNQNATGRSAEPVTDDVTMAFPASSIWGGA